MAWDFSTEPWFEEHLTWIEQFVREQVWPLEREFDDLSLPEAEKVLADLRAQVRKRGLWAPHLGVEAGGQGFGQLQLGLIHEHLGTSHIAPLAFGANAPDSGNAELLARFGTEPQRERYLTPLVEGRAWSAFSMTEPDVAGSDPTLLQTRAVRDGDDWVIDGHKWFTTNGSIADFLIVMAVTEPEAAPHQRATMFLVDRNAPGVEVVRDVGTMEHPHPTGHGIGGHAEIRYHGVRVSADQVLGGVGEGFTLAQRRLGPGRIHHCMRWLGLSRRAFELMCSYAAQRFAHGSLLADKQDIQTWIADAAAQMQAARLMTLHAAWTIDQKGDAAARQEIAMIKYFGADVLLGVVDRAIQVHGARGYSTDTPLEQMYRMARAARIYDGPDEVHRRSVARAVLRTHVERTAR